MADYSWFNKRRQRSIDQLRPWSNNPRLNPEEQHVNLRDYIEDIIEEAGDKVTVHFSARLLEKISLPFLRPFSSKPAKLERPANY